MIILEWTVPVDGGRYKIGGGSVVEVASQYGKVDEIQVWTVELDEESMRMPMRSVTVVGTGHILPQFGKPLGTAIVANGKLVWHLVEIM